MINKIKPNTTKKIKAFTARLPQEMVDKLDEIAKEKRWSRATTLEVLLENELTNVKTQEA